MTTKFTSILKEFLSYSPYLKKSRLAVLAILLLFSFSRAHAQCDPAQLMATQVNGTCFANASITADLSSQSNCLASPGPYQYVLTTPTGTLSSSIDADGTAHTFGDLPAGTYSLRITNGIAAQDVQYSGNPIMVTSNYVPMVITSSGVAGRCSPSSDKYVPSAELTIDVAGGTGPFLYEVTSSLGTMTFGPTTDQSHTFTGLPDGEQLNFKVTDLVNNQPGCSVNESQTRTISPDNGPSASLNFNVRISRDCSNTLSCNAGIVTSFVFEGPNSREPQTYLFANNSVFLSINGGAEMQYTLASEQSGRSVRLEGFPTIVSGDTYDIRVETECNTFNYSGTVSNASGPFADIEKVTITPTVQECIGITSVNYSMMLRAVRFCDNSTVVVQQESPQGSGTFVDVYTDTFNGGVSNTISLPGSGTYRAVYTDSSCGATFTDIETIDPPLYNNVLSDIVADDNIYSYLNGTGGIDLDIPNNNNNNGDVIEFPLDISISPVPFVATSDVVATGPYTIDDTYTITWPYQETLTSGTDFKLLNLPLGDYEVTITDNCGTVITDSVTVDNPTMWAEPDFSVVPGCANSNIIEYNLNIYDPIRNSTGDRRFGLRLYTDDGTGNPDTQLEYDDNGPDNELKGAFFNLFDGDYILQIEARNINNQIGLNDKAFPDNIPRFYNYPITIEPYGNITVENSIAYCDQADPNSGIITSTITGGTAVYPIVYELYDVATTTLQQTYTETNDTLLTYTFDNISSGDYFVKVKTPCYEVDVYATVDIASVTPPLLTSSNIVVCPGTDTIILSLKDPGSIYDITWTQGATTLGTDNPLTINVTSAPGTTVTYTGTYGFSNTLCPATSVTNSVDIDVTVVDDPDTSLSVSDIGDICVNDAPYDITISGGIGGTQTDYTYEILDENGDSFSPALTAVGNGGALVINVPVANLPSTFPAAYSVKATTTAGNTSCSAILTDTIAISNSKPNDTLALSGSTVCSKEDGTITITAAESSITYEVLLADASLTPPVTGVGTGADLVLTIPKAQMIPGTTTYTVSATGTSCTVALEDSVDVTETTGLDSDGDGIVNDCDLDDDNDGILDSVECPVYDGLTASTAFTALSMANAVTTAGVYFFNIGGQAFSTYVDASGYVQVAIDFGNGSGNLPQGTSLTNTTRGVLDAATLATLTATDEVRISHSGGQFDVVNTDAGIISKVVNNQTIHNGPVDNALNANWTGTNASYITGGAGCGGGSTALNERIASLNCNANGMHWSPSEGLQRYSYDSGEIGTTETLKVWVRSSSSIVLITDTDGDGIADCLDLDSDNDGIYDLVESGADPSLDANLDGTIDAMDTPATGDSDNDGLADSIETTNGADTGTTPRETTVGTPDYINLDSDADGCSDAVEAYSDFDIDGSDGGIYNPANATTEPYTVGAGIDADGSVTAAAYTAPADFDGSSTQDYIEAAYSFCFCNDPSDPDTDGDGIRNNCDLDDDNDGVLDSDEGIAFVTTCPLTYSWSGTRKGSRDRGAPNDLNRDFVFGDNFAFNLVFSIPTEVVIQVVSGDNSYGHTGTITVDGVAQSINHTAGEFKTVNFSPATSTTYAIDALGSNVGFNSIVVYDLLNNVIAQFDIGTTGSPLEAGYTRVSENTASSTLVIPCTVIRDTDSDGTPDYLDLDSDNDGIYDLVESGADPSLDANLDGTIDAMDTPATGDTDSDGLADSIETTNGADTGTTPRETTVGTPDYLNLDSDGDGCSDAAEAYSDFDIDGSDGGIYNPANATAEPYTVGAGIDADGSVTAAAYTAPADFDGSSTQDYIESAFSFCLCNDPSDPDTDGDGLRNNCDLDDDNDGILDSVECSATGIAENAIIPAGQEARWTFENSTNDITNGHNAQGGTNTYDVNGINGSTAAAFNGTSDFLQYSDGTFLNVAITSFTYSLWVNPNNLTGVQTIIDEGGNVNGAVIRLNGSTLEAIIAEGATQMATGTFIFPNDGAWHHVALTYDNGAAILYLDGVASATLATGFGQLDAHGDPFGLGATNTTDATGAASTGNYYDGLIDNVTYYTSTLTSAQIASFVASTDTDGDGIPDCLDLDSDNDGIYDLVESGADPSLDANLDGTIDAMDTPATGDSDNDGLADSIETTNGADTGTTPRETTVGTPDYINLDSDGDGCSDAAEAYSDFDIDGSDGGIYNPANATAEPYTVGAGIDADGSVTAAAYTAPADFDGSSTQDYIESAFSFCLCNDPSDPDTDGDGIRNTCDLDDDNDGILDSVECQLIETNVALSGAATQSSTNYGGTADLAIDGNTNGVFSAGSATHTNGETNPFWEVSFATSVISTVNVFNRTDCCGDRLDNFVMEILDLGAVVYTYTHGSAGASINIPVSNVIGDQVRIRLVGSSKRLSLAEVQVIALEQLDTDGDGIADCLDLDSDNDGCTDADEAYTDTTADGDDTGLFGIDTPTVANGLVNNNGLVISAGLVDIGTAGSDDDEAYTTTPATTTGGENTFQQAVELATTAPVDDAACVDGTAEFKSTLTVTATPATTPATVVGTTTSDQINYVWQVSTDSGTTFTDITAAGTAPAYADFTGTATTGTEVTLGLSNVPLSADDYQYQVAITHEANICSVVSAAATLTVNTNPVATTNNVAVCKGVTSATITVTATTGTPINYTIDYDTAAETAGFSDVSTAATLTGASYAVPSAPTAGTYNGTLTYIDANGCSGTDAFTVTVKPVPILALTSATNPTNCTPGNNGKIVLSTTDLPDGSYTINYEDASAVAQTTTMVVVSNVGTISNLTVGTYNNIKVTNLSCTSVADINVVLKCVEIDLVKTVSTAPTDNGDGTFTVGYTVTATNSGSVAGVYDIVEDFNPGTGITFTSGTLAYGAEADGTNGTTAAVADGATIVDNEGLAAGATESWTITAIFTVDPTAITAAGSDCDTTNDGGAGTGFANSISGSSTDTDTTDDVACAGLPIIDLVKTVSGGPTDNGDGTFTVGYTVTATNSGSVAGVYDIVEDFNPGTGITFTSGTLAYGAEADGTNGTTAAVADGATIVDNEGLSSGATESWTITAIFTVDPTAITAAGSDCDTTNDGGAGTGFANSISGSSTDTDTTDNSACAALPIIDLVKTVSTAPTDNGDGTFTVGYTVTATNSGSVAGVYDIVEDFNPGTGITFTSGTLAYGAEADGTNGTTAAVADGATIVDNEGLSSGATESWTITAIFTVDPTAITAAGSDCDTTNDGGAGTGFANSISGSSTDTDTTDNSACAALPIIDLVKTVSTAPTDNGDGTFTVGYTVTATNSGSVAGMYDIVEDFNPGTGITFTSGTLAYGAEADGTNGTTAAVADGATIVDNEGLSSGATESWTITAIFTVDPTAITAAGSDCDTTNDGGAGTGFANSISGSSTDTDTTDDVACAGLPIIDLVKTVSGGPTDNGDGTFTVGYTVTATNSGSVAGVYDIVEDFNPGTGITFTSGTLAYGAEADGTNGTTAAVADGATIVDNEGLAAGATESWTITAIFTVDPTAITAAGSDCDTTNDGGAGTGFANSISGSSTDTDTTDDVACAGLTIIDLVKTVSGGPTDNGDGTFTVGYTVTATNSGSVAGVYDIVEDFNPGTGITFTSGTLAYGAEADGTNGTTAAVADGATIVDNEGLAAGATESWTITAIFTVDPTAITAAGSDCDTTNDSGAGTGFANSISGSSTDTDTTDDVACAGLPIIDLVKTVSGGPTDNGDGTFTVGYTVTATNSGSVAGVYDIVEDFNPGTGITFTSGTLAYGAEADGTNGTTAAVADGATIVDNEGLSSGATESWTITAIFTVDPTAITAAGSDCDTTNDGGAGTGFANSISGSSTDTDTTDDVACAGLPIIDLVKTVSGGPTDNGDGTFTVGYTVTATNSGSVAGVYDIVEDFNPGTGITFTSGTLAYGAEADGTNGTTAAVADGATIVDNEGLAAGATESWTITAIFTVDPTAITAAGSDCDTTNDSGAGTGFANSISGSSTDTDTTDDVACAGLPIIDLVKTVSTAPTDNGDGTFTVGYTVTATNSGSVAGVYDIVEDFNPGTGITFTSGTLAYGAEADGTNGTTAAVADGATIVDNEGLAAGATESWTITAIFTVDPTAITAAGSDCDTTNDGGAGTGFANSISGSSTDTDTTDNSACAGLPIIDLVKTVSTAPTDNGDGTFTVGYTVTATNSGSVAGVYDIVEDFNPGTGITFTSGTLAYGAEADGTNGTTAAVADGATIVDNEGLAAGATESWTITAIFTVDPTAITAAGSDCDTTNDSGAGTGFANSISGSSTDTDTTDDVACAGLPIIDLVKTVSTAPTDNGDGTFTVGYTVTATNSGSVAGMYDIVEDFNPGTGITFTSGTLAYGAEADGTNGTTAAVADGATIVDNEGLAAGATESWTITAIFTVDPTAITAAGSDCDTTNDGGAGTGFANSISGSSTDTDTTDDVACAGLTIIDLVKTVSGGPTDNGDGTFTVGYTVTATNSGSVAGVYDIVEDFNPGTGITFTSGTLAYGAEADGTNGTTAAVADGATIVDNEGLAAGATESWTITAIFTVDPTAITAAGSDCDTTNDSGAGTGFANSISGSSTDTDTTDDVACAGLPIIDLVKTVSGGPTDNGDGTFTVGYTVTATNSGSVAGVYDIVEDFNPGTGITFTSGTLAYGAEADGTNGTTAAVADGATIVDNEGLAAGATESWTITAIFTVDPTAITAAGSDCDTTNDGGAGTGFANSISGSSTDTDTTDDVACAGLPIIDLVKTVSGGPTDNGDGTFTVGYTVTATNSGSVAGVYDIVEDFNPGTGITFTSGTLAYGAEADGTNGTTAAVADGATIVDNEGLSSGATESWTITAIFTVDPTAITAAGSDCDTTNDGGAGTGFANSISGSSTDTDTTDDVACAGLPIIDLVKTVSGGPTDNGDGTFTVGYTVTATNSGSVAGVYDIVEDFNPGTGITFTSGTLAYGAEADGTNGTTAAVADGATIVDNEGLAAGATESWTITAIFTVDPTAITAAGSDCDTTNDSGAGTGFANSISGSSTDTDTTDDVACAGLPIIDLVKTVSTAPTDNGDGTFTVGYTVTATNSGSVAGMYDIVEDFNPGTGITFTSGTLAYGAEADGTNGTTAAVADGATIVDNEGLSSGATESWTITAIFTVDPTAITAAGSDCDTTNDGGAGTGFANSISGSSTDTDTTDDVACAALLLPSIAITKEGAYVDGNGDGITNIGDRITYTFTVKNTGNVILTDITVTDPDAAISGGPLASLAVGATDTTTFTGAHTLSQADIDSGNVYNLATATGTPPSGPDVTDESEDPTPCASCPIDPACTDCTITPLAQNPSIGLLKTSSIADTNADGIVGNLGDTIIYVFTIENTGNVTLSGVTISDPLPNIMFNGGPIASLAPGAIDTTTFTASYVITQADIDAGEVFNQATVSGEVPGGDPADPTDDITDTSDDPNDPTDDDGDPTDPTDDDGEPDDPTVTPLLAQDPCAVSGPIDEADLLNLIFANADCDGDGVTNGEEIDPDGDGRPGGTGPEGELSTNWNDPCDYNEDDITLLQTSGWSLADCDGDGTPNGEELPGEEFDPCKDDGTTGDEDLSSPIFANSDCDGDGDGVLDATELGNGTDPMDACDYDPIDITVPITATTDCDGDGVLDATELTNGTDPKDACSYRAGDVTGPIKATEICDIVINNDLIGPDIDDGFFRIENIESFPDNTVAIYNRWGVKVFGVDGYDNASKVFSGISDGRFTLQQREQLPVGVYFYFIKYNIDGLVKTKTGYLYINR